MIVTLQEKIELKVTLDLVRFCVFSFLVIFFFLFIFKENCNLYHWLYAKSDRVSYMQNYLHNWKARVYVDWMFYIMTLLLERYITRELFYFSTFHWFYCKSTWIYMAKSTAVGIIADVHLQKITDWVIHCINRVWNTCNRCARGSSKCIV